MQPQCQGLLAPKRQPTQRNHYSRPAGRVQAFAFAAYGSTQKWVAGFAAGTDSMAFMNGPAVAWSVCMNLSVTESQVRFLSRRVVAVQTELLGLVVDAANLDCKKNALQRDLADLQHRLDHAKLLAATYG